MIVVVGLFRRRDKCCKLGVDSFTPELEVPIDKSAIMVVDLGVFDDYSPVADSGFSPKVRG
jgi:hypothetical protein